MLILRRILILILTIFVVFVVVIGGVVVGLNTGAGRAFAEREINHFAGPNVQISGLAGHFPQDIKLGAFSVADGQGVWLHGTDAQLRWKILPLLHRDIDVTSLSVATLDILRQPVAVTPKSSSVHLPKFHLNIDHLAAPDLHLAAVLAGEDVALKVSGATQLNNATQGNILLDAATLDGSANYHLDARIDPKTVAMQLAVNEPPGGLLGHFAGPTVHAPFVLNLSLAGPRGAAALHFAAALGAAQLSGNGTLDLNPDTATADIMLSVPALAPFGALAGQNIAGTTNLHLAVSQQSDGGANLALNGNVALTAAPHHVASWIGPDDKFALLANLQGKTVNIQQLNISGAAFTIGATGIVAQSGVNLSTHVVLSQVQDFSPGLSGNVTEDGTIIGTAKDFAVDALLAGDIREHKIPSGPFSISIDAQHLPLTPSGTLTGSGALENSPLLLDAAFSRDANGATTLTINNAIWRSLNAQADLALAPGTLLPTGTANFTLGRLADFAPFSPVPLQGSVTGDFGHLGGERFKLDLDVKNLIADPRVGAVNGKLNALGPTDALQVKLQANIAKIFNAPARVVLAGLFNLDARSANLTSLSAGWRQLDAELLGPVQITTQPGIAVQHLALALDGGRLTLDGTFTPKLNAKLSLQNLPARLASMFAPSIDASGMLSGSAAITGSANAPAGQISLQARAMQLHTGPAAALPPADFDGTASLSGNTANIATKLTAGPNIALTADGLVPFAKTGALNLHVIGHTDLRLLDPILAVQGSVARGIVAADLIVTGNANSPRAQGSVTLSNGSVENIGSGLNLTQISARLLANGRHLDLQSFQATAGQGTLSGNGTADLGQQNLPLDLHINAQNATPVSSDVVTETLDAALTLNGALKGNMALGGAVNIDAANINIPKSLPPSVANLTIVNAGAPPPPPPPPSLPIALDLTVKARNKIFVRGDGLFAELGGKVHITGTAADPDPEGGFDLIRGSFSLAGRNLEFTQGTVSFNGAGFMPTLELEATTVTTDNNGTATLIVGGTAAKPTITLTSSPPLPSDEILAQLLFGQSATSLTAFQAASLAAALAQLAGVGGGSNPLDSVRNALGLDQLSLGGSGTGPPSLQAGRYIAPGVYVGASQATNGQGTQASVQVNLYKGLKLQTTTGTSGTGSGTASSVGLTYQFNY